MFHNVRFGLVDIWVIRYLFFIDHFVCIFVAASSCVFHKHYLSYFFVRIEMGIESPTLLDPEGNVITDMYELPNGCKLIKS